MPKTVDKVKKKREIALAAPELMVEDYKNAKTMASPRPQVWAKGPSFSTFANKEETVIELFEHMFEIRRATLESHLYACRSEAKKILACLHPGYVDKITMYKIHRLRSLFASASLLQTNPAFRQFHTRQQREDTPWLEEYLRLGICSCAFREIDLKTCAQLFQSTLHGTLCLGIVRGIDMEATAVKVKFHCQSLLETIKRRRSGP